MVELTLKLSDEMLARIRDEAEQLHVPVNAVVNAALEQYFDEDDEPTNEEILESIRRALLDVAAGRVRPVDEVLAELRQEFDFDADES